MIARFVALTVLLLAGSAQAAPLTLTAGKTVFTIVPDTLRIDADYNGTSLAIMPPLHPPERASPVHDRDGWHWSDTEGRIVNLSVEGEALRVVIAAPTGQTLDWSLPPADEGTWLIPDGEGMAFPVVDPFWRKAFRRETCLDASAGLSFPAWSYLKAGTAVTYALGDGLRSQLCTRDNAGLQSRLTHSFDEGANRLEVLFAVRPANPLAPALFYRQLIKARGQFKSLAEKSVPDLPRLYGAPQAYVWGDGRDMVFLDELRALGISRLNISYDQNPETNKHLVTTAYMRKARAMGYLIGPYDVFDNGQSPGEDTSPYALWDKALYPSGCIQDAAGKPLAGFADTGCEMSSEALVRAAGPFVPGVRYARHRADGANQVFIDVDAYGEFYYDYSPDHPMTMTKDRANRLARLDLGIRKYHLVLGSENAIALECRRRSLFARNGAGTCRGGLAHSE